ncbi:MAG: Lrp/AsnC family transcriptional regulator [Clostridia bacterium]|nr:Lrp/AsnC family transcriptional regulator [Clostridia bacterium]
MEKLDKKILKLLYRNAKLNAEEIATMLGEEVALVKVKIKEMEQQGYIRGYKAVVDWDKTDSTYVSAIIQLKVTPKAGLGFEEIAEKVMKYPEVETVYLMSGVYDLHVVVKGKTFQQVAMFVAKELSTIEAVNSTATHFVLRRYKEFEVELVNTDTDDRGNFLL